MIDTTPQVQRTGALCGSRRNSDAVESIGYKFCLFFFVFPIFSPALGGTVVYPFVLYGFYLFFRTRWTRNNLLLLFVSFELGLAYCLVDMAGAIRLIAFVFGCYFVRHTLLDKSRSDLMMRYATWHAVIVLIQFLLVLVDVPIDFSQIVGSIYGGLLPPTGINIDYNAFSQFDLFLPRVAGLNREPAFACILFLGLLSVALSKRRLALTALMVLAVFCTLSKIAFPLVLALLITCLPWGKERPRRFIGFAGKLLVFALINVGLLISVKSNVELIETAMLLDASFYHRFIGLHTISEEFSAFSVIGNSRDVVSAAPIFADYEFRDEKRAFLDGNVIAKLLVDFGYIAAALYWLAVGLIAASVPAAAALAIAGVFTNILSLAPATVLLFVLLCGFAKPATKVSFRQTIERCASRLSHG